MRQRHQPLPDPPTLFAQRDVILEHYRMAEELYGADRCGALMRKFGIKYSVLHPQGEQLRVQFAQAKTRGDWQAVIDDWYQQDLPGVHPDARTHRLQGSCAAEEKKGTQLFS